MPNELCFSRQEEQTSRKVAVTLSIKDNEADSLARQLSERTGESLTEAVKRALQERLDREAGRAAAQGMAERLLTIGRLCAAQVRDSACSSDHAELLYDDRGLPR
jgi:antitoxin VapB